MNNEKSIKITDFLTEIQSIDIVRVISIITSYIIYFTAKKPIMNNYNLRKDFKIKNVNTAALPIEVVRKFNDIDEKKY